ncbi:uncharacterized protein LOC111558559 isoform X2 [Felis catus]|nr:uncharacterized protein LOC111558559 isoform X2 [Felis catus]
MPYSLVSFPKDPCCAFVHGSPCVVTSRLLKIWKTSASYWTQMEKYPNPSSTMKPKFPPVTPAAADRNEDRKTALLNLLSVKGLLGIFSMWRKIRKSPRNFCQAAEVTDSSHTPLGLVNSYQGFRGGSSSLPTSEKEETTTRIKEQNYTTIVIIIAIIIIKHLKFCSGVEFQNTF